MRIGIFGGAFNPPHPGHISLAERVKQAAHLDKIIVMPTGMSPHKSGENMAKGSDRLEMCRLAFDRDYYSVSSAEIMRQGKSYTYDTLCELKKLYKDDSLFLIIGSDMLLSFHKWYKHDKILDMVTLCVISRETDIDFRALSDYSRDVLKLDTDKGEIIIADVEAFPCSSTQIRGLISAGRIQEAPLTESVRDYIITHSLYTDSFTAERAVIRKLLGDYRYNHSLCVADSAVTLAEIYGADKKKAYLAGLLHDVMKDSAAEIQLQIIEKGGIILSRTEINAPPLWHAIAGECYLRCEMGISDPDILGSVRYHTTGRAGMTLLEKIIYIADYISSDRSYPDVEEMRRLALTQSLEKAALYSLKYTFMKQTPAEGIIHTDSIDFYNELIIEKGLRKND